MPRRLDDWEQNSIDRQEEERLSALKLEAQTEYGKELGGAFFKLVHENHPTAIEKRKARMEFSQICARMQIVGTETDYAKAIAAQIEANETITRRLIKESERRQSPMFGG